MQPTTWPVPYAAISPGQWQPWTAVSALLGLGTGQTVGWCLNVSLFLKLRNVLLIMYVFMYWILCKGSRSNINQHLD